MDNSKIRISGTIKEIQEHDPDLIKDWDVAIAKENAKDNELR